jgi:ArsR family transcriptional regulator, arsenate/arsenite/antimonite-responsive transcriptional repressor
MKMCKEEEQFVTTMAGILKALGDPNRLRVLWYLSAYQEEELCVNDLSRNLCISQPAVSQHIKVLKGIGLLQPQKRGFHVYYKIDSDRLLWLKSQVDEMFAQAGKKCET